NVAYLAIVDETGSTLAEENRAGLTLTEHGTLVGTGLLRTHRIDRSTPVEYDGQKIGKIVLAYSLKSSFAEVNRSRFTVLFVMGLMLLIGLVVVLRVSRQTASRIIRL